MDLTAAQLTRLRQRPHKTTLNLGIFRPQVVVTAQINQPNIPKGRRVINITVTGGDIDLVQGDETVYIGTAQGEKDIDRIRVRSITSTTITLAENSITWEDGWYLTVVRFFEPWGVFPRITLDSNNIPTFFKDFDITYSNQNRFLDPVVCLGPSHAGFLLPPGSPTGTHQIFYTSSGTFDPTFGTITGVSFNWHFEGGDPTGSTVPDPGYINYTGCGNFVTSLEVTTQGGQTFTGRRHIQILTRPDVPGPCKPILKWGLRSLSGSRDSGGYNGTIWIREPVNPEDIVDGAMIVIFSDDAEGGVELEKVAANAENRGKIFFVGYILEDSINYDPATSLVEFKVGSVTERMKELSTFSTALDDKKASQTISWTDMTEMTVDRSVIHFLRWHSTVLAVADFAQTGDDKRVQFIDFPRGNIYPSVQQLLDSTLFATINADRQGKVWTEVDANMKTTGSSRQENDYMQDVIEITRQDWLNQVTIERDASPDLAYVELGGIAYSGPVTGTFDAFLAGAPGFAPEYSGGATRVSGLVIEGQTPVNALSGLFLARATPLFPSALLGFAGDYRFLDIAPQHRVGLTVAENDTFRRITLDNKPFIPWELSYGYRPQNQSLSTEITLVPETDGPPGDTIIIPVDPPYDQTILPDWDIDFPPIIIPDPVIPPVLPPPGSGDLAYLMTRDRLSRSRDFATGRATGSTWENITPRPETSIVTGSITQFRLHPQDPANTAYLLTNVFGGGAVPPNGPHLYKINNLNGPTGSQVYTEILNPDQVDDLFGPGLNSQLNSNDFGVSAINDNIIFYQGRFASLGAPVNIMKTNDGGLTWTDGSGDIPFGDNQNNQGFIWPSEKSIGDVFTKAELDRHLYVSNNQGSTYTKIFDNAGNPLVNIHIPFNANPADRIIYMTQLGANKYLLTKDQFNTNIDITPVFDGEFWTPPSFGGQGQPERLMASTWYLNRLLVAGVFELVGPERRNVFFYATDGVDGGVNSWLPGFQFPQAGGNNTANAFEWHRTNEEIMAVTIDGNTNHLYLSTDRGLSFIDGMDNWEAGEGLGSTTGFGALSWAVIAIRFVWTT